MQLQWLGQLKALNSFPDESEAMELKIRRCGENLIILLPEELVAKFGWDVGDILSGEISANGVTIVRTMTAHDHAMNIAREAMDEYRETFVSLAKS